MRMRPSSQRPKLRQLTCVRPRWRRHSLRTGVRSSGRLESLLKRTGKASSAYSAASASATLPSRASVRRRDRRHPPLTSRRRRQGSQPAGACAWCLTSTVRARSVRGEHRGDRAAHGGGEEGQARGAARGDAAEARGAREAGRGRRQAERGVAAQVCVWRVASKQTDAAAGRELNDIKAEMKARGRNVTLVDQLSCARPRRRPLSARKVRCLALVWRYARLC